MAESKISKKSFNEVVAHIAVNNTHPGSFDLASNTNHLIIGTRKGTDHDEASLYFHDYQHAAIFPIVQDTLLTFTLNGATLSVTSGTGAYKYLTVYQL